MTLSQSGVRASYSFAWSFVFALNWTPPFSPGARIEYAVPPAKSILGGAAPASAGEQRCGADGHR